MYFENLFFFFVKHFLAVRFNCIESSCYFASIPFKYSTNIHFADTKCVRPLAVPLIYLYVADLIATYIEEESANTVVIEKNTF